MLVERVELLKTEIEINSVRPIQACDTLYTILKLAQSTINIVIVQLVLLSRTTQIVFTKANLHSGFITAF